jgi:hypothetical protein
MQIMPGKERHSLSERQQKRYERMANEQEELRRKRQLLQERTAYEQQRQSYRKLTTPRMDSWSGSNALGGPSIFGQMQPSRAPMQQPIRQPYVMQTPRVKQPIRRAPVKRKKRKTYYVKVKG